MSLKREVSKSIANLQHSVKRLAIGEQEDDTEITSSISPSLLNMENEFNVPALEQVLSTSRQDFDETYEKLDEIGRGGFSVVYRCRSRVTGEIFAVKVITFCSGKVNVILVPDNRLKTIASERKI